MSGTPQRNPAPRPPSSVYSKYIPGNFDRNNLPPTAYESSSPPLILNMSRHYRTRPRVPFTINAPPSLPTRAPPLVPSRQERSQIGGRAQLLHLPIAQQYPTPRTFRDASTSTTELSIPNTPISQPRTRRVQRPRGIVLANTETRESVSEVNLYWDYELQEWRSIPGIKRDDPSDDSESDGFRRRQSKLKGLKSILQVLKDLGNPADKKDKDDHERRRALRRSISGPVV